MQIGGRVSAILLAASSVSFAQPATTDKSGAGSESGPMSQQEVLACIEQEEQLRTRTASLQVQASQHEKETSALLTEAKGIGEVQRATQAKDKTTQEKLARRVDTHNKRVEAHNRAAEQLHNESAAIAAEAGRYNATCAARPFDPRDREAALAVYRGRAQAATQSTVPAPAVPPSPQSPFEEGLKAFDQGKFDTAFALWLPLAEQGRLAAQFNIATMFEKGLGVERNDAQAASWYLKAAEQGDVASQYKVGTLYESGQGVPLDLARAGFWYEQASTRTATDLASTEAARLARDRLLKLPKEFRPRNEEVVSFEGGRFVIQRAASKDCVVALQGAVNTSAIFKFEDALNKARAQGCATPLTLLLESPGGGHFDGLRLGRMVRDEGMRTVARYECASACATIFMGGVERTLWGARAAIGFHQVAVVGASDQNSDRRCLQSSDSRAATELRRYLRFVASADADQIYKMIMSTSCKSIEWVTGQRAVDLGVATRVEAQGVDVFGPKDLRLDTQ